MNNILDNINLIYKRKLTLETLMGKKKESVSFEKGNMVIVNKGRYLNDKNNKQFDLEKWNLGIISDKWQCGKKFCYNVIIYDTTISSAELDLVVPEEQLQENKVKLLRTGYYEEYKENTPSHGSAFQLNSGTEGTIVHRDLNFYYVKIQQKDGQFILKIDKKYLMPIKN